MIKKGTPILINKTDLQSYLSDEEIAYKYIVGFRKIGEAFKSELRNESKPSARVSYGDYGLIYKDFGDPMLPDAISVIKYVQVKYNLNDYQSALNKIAIDFGLVKGEDSSFSIIRSNRKKVKREVIKPPSDLILKIKKRDWSIYDKDYWNQYYIPLSLLKRNNICAISHLFIGNNHPIEFASNHCAYSYNYYWSRNIFRRKIYQPTSEEYKWLSNIDDTIVQNQPNIPKSGDLLFIQSSYKDCMSMELLNFWAVAPNKEGSWFTDTYWNKLKQRYKKIILMWNNDHFKSQNSGLLMAQNFSKKYNIPYIMTPAVDEITDISEFNRDYGLNSGKDLIMDLIKELDG